MGEHSPSEEESVPRDGIAHTSGGKAGSWPVDGNAAGSQYPHSAPTLAAQSVAASTPHCRGRRGVREERQCPSVS